MKKCTERKKKTKRIASWRQSDLTAGCAEDDGDVRRFIVAAALSIPLLHVFKWISIRPTPQHTLPTLPLFHFALMLDCEIVDQIKQKEEKLVMLGRYCPPKRTSPFYINRGHAHHHRPTSVDAII
jgi:hypothetical protein